MGGVLIDFNPQYFLNTILNNENDRKILMQEIFLAPEWKMMDNGDLDEQDMFDIVCKRIPEHLKDAAHYLIFHWNEIALKFEDVSDYIKELSNRGYKIYLLSNASHRLVNEYWVTIKGHEYFDGIVVSAFLHLLKPDKRIYEYLINKYELKPSECIFIDDSKKNVDAAISLGMKGIYHDKNASNLRNKLEKYLKQQL